MCIREARVTSQSSVVDDYHDVAQRENRKTWSGAIGGIVGGIVGGIALLGAVLLLLWRRRKAQSPEPAEETFLPPELYGNEKGEPLIEDGGHILELSRNERPAELEQPLVELEAREHHNETAAR